MAQECAKRLAEQGVHQAALMATQGIYRVGLYERTLQQAEVQCYMPTEPERECIMQGIYEGVKAGNMPLA